ncbi:MAG: TlpA disulfide reductase family protein [Acidobacteriota bacterium]|nr:TlpA disulfide reductase family protein [Acidobacteriota bacterium]
MIQRTQTIFNALLLGICLSLVVGVAATANAQDLPKADGSGDIPDMLVELYSPTGAAKSVKLSSLRGKVVLMDIFWSRCPHCEEHAPQIVQLYNQYRQRGFTVIGLATDRKESKDDVNSLKSFLERTKINYPVGFLTGEIRFSYADPKDAGVPQIIVFGADGKMALREVGWTPAQADKVKKAIEAQLAKAPTRKPSK